MKALWAVSWLGFGLLGGIVLKTALDELERRAGYAPAPLAAPSFTWPTSPDNPFTRRNRS